VKNDLQTEGKIFKEQGAVEKKNEPVPIETIHPIAESGSKPEPIQTELLKKTDGSMKNDTDKIFPPLPTEKVVVRFKYDNNEFTEEGLNMLVDFTDILAMHSGAKIVITGYTDAEGYENYNQKLSEFRANIVRSFFLGRGIKPDQIEVIGAGSKKPIESNETAWGRMMNRRVEIEVKKK